MADNRKSPADSLDQIAGIGPSYQKILARLDLATIHDLIHHYPCRYLDYRISTPINQLAVKIDVSFTATIGEPKHFTSKSGKLITQAEAVDSTGKIKLTWFNNSFISRVIIPGEKYLIAGKTSFWADKLTIIAPIIERVGQTSIHTHGLVPIYPLTAKLTSRFLRQKIHLALESTMIKDPLDQAIIKELNLFSYRDSLQAIHFPKNPSTQNAADLRLAFNHHLAINLNNQIELKKLPQAPAITIDQKLHHRLIKTLPFTLTAGQQKAIRAGYSDLTKSRFTHRLIQGETGSGKTVVIYFYASQLLANHYSFALLSPTEILARQHYLTFLKFGLPKTQVVLVTGTKPLKETPKKPTIFIGTHALLNQLPQNLTIPLAAVAIDEQHKFGVEQRQVLVKRNPSPHLFNLTATPIPRTLALGIFGEVSISTLSQKPKNRLPVKTWVVPPTRYQNSTSWIKDQLTSGSKIFVVCPLIHESEKSRGTHGVEKTYQEYQKKYHMNSPIFMIHGEMAIEKIGEAMASFKKAKQAILVSTSIIEVGIDIPEADVIIIHSAERFGLASLHQLRGRVGRGERQSYCLLVPTKDEQEEEDRLILLQTHHSGLMLSKMDLRLRGSGELFGTRQHGWLPVRLKNFWNKKLFGQAREVALDLIAQNEKEAPAIAKALLTW